MNWYTKYKLVPDGEGYTLEIYLNNELTEFAKEFLSEEGRESLNLEDKIKALVKDKFSDLKITTVKLMVGAIVVASIPFLAATQTTAAAATPAAVTQPAGAVQGTYTVTASKLNVRSGPSTSHSIIHALWQGNKVTVIGESGNWYNIRLSDGRTGWVSKQYINTASPTDLGLGTVTASKLNVRTGPSTTYGIMHVLWQGNKVKVIGQSGNWYNIRLSDGRTGWVSKDYLKLGATESKPDAKQQSIDKVIAVAKAQLGMPYVFAGSSPADGGFDCSGLTQYSFKQAGYLIDRISSSQATNGIFVSKSNIKPGDLVFFSINMNGRVDHVGIYLGNGQMIHSPKPGDVVKIVNINVGYWQQRYLTARRIIY